MTSPPANRHPHARVAHLFGLSWDAFAHVLGTFPLVFPNTDAGKARIAALHKAVVALA